MSRPGWLRRPGRPGEECPQPGASKGAGGRPWSQRLETPNDAWSSSSMWESTSSAVIAKSTSFLHQPLLLVYKNTSSPNYNPASTDDEENAHRSSPRPCTF